jgi:hypothetical protein
MKDQENIEEMFKNFKIQDKKDANNQIFYHLKVITYKICLWASHKLQLIILKEYKI